MDPVVEIGTSWTGVGIDTLALHLSLRMNAQTEVAEHKLAVTQTLRRNVALKCHRPRDLQVMIRATTSTRHRRLALWRQAVEINDGNGINEMQRPARDQRGKFVR
jgi:hypothetical protein